MTTGTIRKGGRRTAIGGWRVKAGNHEVFAALTKNTCVIWARAQGGKVGGKKLRLIPPNV